MSTTVSNENKNEYQKTASSEARPDTRESEAAKNENASADANGNDANSADMAKTSESKSDSGSDNNALPEPPTQTFGEKMVGKSISPLHPEDAVVAKIKSAFADVIDEMDDIRHKPASSEKLRLASIAITEAEGACLRAVKAVTWKD